MANLLRFACRRQSPVCARAQAPLVNPKRSMSYRCKLPVRTTPTIGLEGTNAIYHFHCLETTMDPLGNDAKDHYLEKFKSKLWVNIDDPKVPYVHGDLQKLIFCQLVGHRFDPIKRRVCFTSRHLPNRDANENRVIDLYEEALDEAARLAHKFKCEDEGGFVL